VAMPVQCLEQQNCHLSTAFAAMAANSHFILEVDPIGLVLRLDRWEVVNLLHWKRL